MLSSVQREEEAIDQNAPELLVLDEAPAGAATIAEPLESRGYRVISMGSGSEALHVLRSTRPALAIVAQGKSGREGAGGRLADLRAAARERGIPVLEVVEPGTNLDAQLGSFEDVDDWVMRDCSAEDLGARVARLVRRRSASPIDVPFSAMLVHDLRTPLNVIGLSIRMIEQVLPRDDPEIDEDLRFIDENLRQIERMLAQLSEYARLCESGLSLTVGPFDPRRLVDELLETREINASRHGKKGSSVRLDIQKSCPSEVTLDQGRARTAIEYALINATAAAHNEPIRLTLRGRPQRWVVEVAIDRPPPSSVTSVELRSRTFDRLSGCAAERRGMDLAIVARISELFGGTAKLEVVAGRGTLIILDWPANINDASTNA